MFRQIKIFVTLSALALGAACGRIEHPPTGTGSNSGTSAPAPASSTAGNVATSAAGNASPPPPATWPEVSGPCTAKPGLLRGKTKQTLTAAGLTRSFIYYAPATLNANAPAPVVIIPHGFSMNADQMFDITRYADIADREGFIAVFPNGQPGGLLDGPWNVGNPDCASSLGGLLPLARGDDQTFLNAILRFAEADQCLDMQHVYVTGFSMGGYFSNETGCLRPEVRAVAPHSGGSHDLAACASQHKPVLLMHFQGDGLIPYSCGQQARDRWVQRNGCTAEAPDVKPVQGGSCQYYKGCPVDGQVAMCTFTIPIGGTRDEAYPGHAWSGGSKLGMGASFAIPETESASQLSWDFFKRYAW
jgi:polyhydroxybutyrate depolymerase